MAGQAHHFRQYAPEKIAYGIARYTNEVNRLYGVMERRLQTRDFLAGDCSIADIADMAAWPWIVPHERLGQDLDDFPDLKKWFETLKERPAVEKGYRTGLDLRGKSNLTSEESRKILFEQRTRA